MLSTRQLTSQILRRKGTLPNAMVIYCKCGYHWGNYDVTPGTCCKIRDKETTECSTKYALCGPSSLPNNCDMTAEQITDLRDEYAKQLALILRPNEADCDLIKHDLCYYKPSDKSRRYQRTWPECPLIWLRPKKTCCFDKEFYPPISRRPRPPPRPPMTAVEKYAFNMSQLCKTCRIESKKKRKCYQCPSPKNCKKPLAPFPSFSECDQSCKRYCPIECSCHVKPTICEMWADHHRNSSLIKKCTQAIVGYCPFKNRSRFLY